MKCTVIEYSLSQKNENKKEIMFISVIIPTRNRANLLEIVLTSITDQTYPQTNFEVIVVDNGSTDNTCAIVDNYRNRISNLKYIYEPKLGLHVGRHAGLAIAKGDILVYCDDDIEAFPTWLDGVAESFQDPTVALVGGNDLPHYESSPPEWIETLWQTTQWGETIGIFSLLDFGNEIKEISPYYVYGCNFSIRKSVLLKVGGFHPDSMPDDLLIYRGDGETAVSDGIFLMRYKTLFNPKASVYHWVPKSRMSFDYLYKRGYMQGISNSYTQIRMNGKHNLTQFIFYFLLYSIKFSKLHIKMMMKKNHSPTDIYYEGFLRGSLFHQKATLKERNLLEWILKRDYFINS